MAKNLNGKRVAVLVDNGFEQIEMTDPAAALRDAGAEAIIVSPQRKKVKGWNHTSWGDEFDVEVSLDDARAEDFDALVLPGGQMNPDNLRISERAVEFTRSFFEAGKPVAAICHGPWLLVEADVVRGRRVTSWPSLKTDLRNAGAEWVDQAVVVDAGLVTSRKPDDLADFNRKMVEEIAEGVHAGQSV